MTGPKQGDLFGAPLPKPSPRPPSPRGGEGRGEGQPASASQPIVAQPIVAQPVAAPPVAAQPIVAQPIAAQPVAAPPAAAPPPEPKKPAWRRIEPPAAPKVLTVSQLTGQVKNVLEPQFGRVLVRGEVSNFRGVNARGHFYFALKDDRASIDVKLWATQAAKLKFQLKDGLSVTIEGSLDVYEPQGRYSLIVSRIEPEGVGAQALAFEQLKQKLLAEGLIGDQRTRPRRELPFLPRRIGVVTSVTGAALRDFLKVLHRRHPRLSVLVADARMQGDGAVFEVRRALRWLCKSNVDVIVVTRGGGSSEDLWTFNEEPVVRAVWECTVPVVSAVGHEIDTTLCDLVADVRAPTPSAAAELLAPQLVELEAHLKNVKARLKRAVEKGVMRERSGLTALESGLGDPRRELSSQRLILSNAADRMRAVLHRKQRASFTALRDLSQRLHRARPQAQLQTRRAQIAFLRTSLVTLLQRELRTERETVSRLAMSLARSSPRPMLQQGRQLLARQAQRGPAAMRARVRREREQLRALAARLDALSPLAVLGRGYAIVTKTDGRIVRRAAEVKPGDEVTIKVSGDEMIVAEVKAR
ncbi:MAG: exodeoxyribonuclease VII large subunit [Archangium sp.]|nr:exodeoxyribonuclease VII large subunit [Archangium sp.]